MPVQPQQRRSALIIFSVINYYREMMPVAQYFKQQGFDTRVAIGWSGSTADEATVYCKEAGFTLVDLPQIARYGDHLVMSKHGAATPVTPSDGAVSEGQAPHGAHNPLRARLRSWLLSIESLVFILSFVTAFYKQLRIGRYAERLLRQSRPDVVFAGHFQSCGKFDNAVAKACRQQKILYCGLTVAHTLGESYMINARFQNYNVGIKSRALNADSSLLARLAARLFPIWMREREGQRLFMFIPSEMLAAWLLGTLEKNPWRKPSDKFDLVFVESELSRQMLAESGYDLSKVLVAGKPLLDVVINNLGNPEYETEFYRYLGLKAGEPFILCNVEPSAYYSSQDAYWRDFEVVMQSLHQTGQPAVLSLHPLCDPVNYRFVEQKYGFRLSEQYKIGQLYPYCSFVVTFPCSTNIFSTLFNRQLIIYDFSGLTSDANPNHDSHRWPGAIYAYDAEQLTQTINDYLKSGDADTRNMQLHQKPASEVIYATVTRRLGQVNTTGSMTQNQTVAHAGD